MRIRHATALIAAAWLLIEPPFGPGAYVATGEALSHWSVHGKFASKDDCLKGKDQNVRVMSRFGAGGQALRQSADLGQCIQDDDPRLKSG